MGLKTVLESRPSDRVAHGKISVRIGENERISANELIRVRLTDIDDKRITTMHVLKTGEYVDVYFVGNIKMKLVRKI